MHLKERMNDMLRVYIPKLLAAHVMPAYAELHLVGLASPGGASVKRQCQTR